MIAPFILLAVKETSPVQAKRVLDCHAQDHVLDFQCRYILSVKMDINSWIIDR